MICAVNFGLVIWAWSTTIVIAATLRASSTPFTSLITPRGARSIDVFRSSLAARSLMVPALTTCTENNCPTMIANNTNVTPNRVRIRLWTIALWLIASPHFLNKSDSQFYLQASSLIRLRP